MDSNAIWTSAFKTSVPRERIEWKTIRDTINLADVVTRLLGPAPGRRGEGGRRHRWLCPFHADRNPSFCIKTGDRHWRCWGCGLKGDAIDFVCRLNPGWTFPEAVAYLAGKPAPSGKPARSRPPDVVMPAKAPECRAGHSSGLPLADALALVESAACCLWTPEGVDALNYLRGRGLTEATVRAAGIGWTPGVLIPKRDGTGSWKALGVTIPWRDGDRLALVKIRQPEGRKPKYGEAFRDRPTLFPAPSVVRIGKPLIITEGELDALLLAQELAELAAVVTLGSASARPEGSTYLAMLPAPAWYVATDADDAGDRSASGWPTRARRVRPPGELKDWTEAHQAEIDLRRWWTERLGGIEAPSAPDPTAWKVSPAGVVEPCTRLPSGTEALPDPREPWPPRPDELASWPIPWRERWGRLANDMEARGASFPESEAEAFRQVKAEMEAGPLTLASPPQTLNIAAEVRAVQETLFSRSSVQDSGLRGGTL